MTAHDNDSSADHLQNMNEQSFKDTSFGNCDDPHREPEPPRERGQSFDSCSDDNGGYEKIQKVAPAQAENKFESKQDQNAYSSEEKTEVRNSIYRNETSSTEK